VFGRFQKYYLETYNLKGIETGAMPVWYLALHCAIGGNSATLLKSMVPIHQLGGPAYHALNHPTFYAEAQKKIINVGLVSPADLELGPMPIADWMETFMNHPIYDFLPPESGVYIFKSFIKKPYGQNIVPVLMKFIKGYMGVPIFFILRKFGTSWKIDAEPIDADRIVGKDEKWFVQIKPYQEPALIEDHGSVAE